MNLKKLRIKNKLTQKNISEYLNITTQTYSNYEIGNTQPDIEMLIKMADFFNISVDELIGHDTKDRFIIISNEEEKTILTTYKSLNHSNKMKVQGYALGLLAQQK